MECTVRQHRHLECNSLWHAEPMETDERISDVVSDQVSCGIKISTVHHLVLSQYTHLTDGRTDRQNFVSNTVRCITCSRTVKTRKCVCTLHRVTSATHQLNTIQILAIKHKLGVQLLQYTTARCELLAAQMS